MDTFIKRFQEWVTVKIRLDNRRHQPPYFNEREIWWCSTGENIGIEISGKGGQFRRPVLVLRKLDKYSFIGLPLTKTTRKGSWYSNISVLGLSNTVILAQIRHYDYRRMRKIITTLTEEEFSDIQNSFINLLINKPPASDEAGGRGECQI